MVAGRGVAQSGRAPGWGPGGRRFEPAHPDHRHADERRVALRPAPPPVTVSRVIADPKRVRRLVAFANPRRSDRVLDAGSGVLALAFAPRVESVVALEWDLRPRRPANVALH